MTQVNVHEAKAKLSTLLRRVEAGEEITIARAGRAVARLVPIVEEGARPIFGSDKGRFEVPDDFDEPIPEIERLFEGGA